MAPDTFNPVLDRSRDYGEISPPETLMVANGDVLPISTRDTDPGLYMGFQDKHRGAIKNITRHYEQDGFSFDAAGRVIRETMDAEAHARADRMMAQQHAKEKAVEAFNEAMREQGMPDSAFVTIENFKTNQPITAADCSVSPGDGHNPATRTAPSDAVAFDVVAWATGKLQAQWFAVRAALREQYAISVTTKEQARHILVERGIVAEGAWAA